MERDVMRMRRIDGDLGFWCGTCEAARHVSRYEYGEDDHDYIWRAACPVCKKRFEGRQRSFFGWLHDTGGAG